MKTKYMKKTKIVCSIGPASNEPEVMEKMVLAGMNIARLNFTHATDEERAKFLSSVHHVRETTGANVAILWDTKGPEFRSGMMENDGIELIPGKTVRVVKESVLGTSERFSVNHPEALDSLKPGDAFLLENAKMKLEVKSVEEDGITCEIISGGRLGNKKSLSVPGVDLGIPYITEQDRADLKYACEHGGEFLATSFVSTPENVLELKEILKSHGREDLQIICKIENQLGVDNLEKILEVSDGVMVARGDLGAEVPSELLPVIQKQMIQTCRNMGKICIVATEMLETMMENSRPKRAETSDIANAVLDGTDAVMLSGETTIGKHPVETVAAMAKICETTEQYADFDYAFQYNKLDDITAAIATNVVESANRLDAKVICAATISGYTARVISNLKPEAPILALVPDEKTGRRLALNWGVYPTLLPVEDTIDDVLKSSVEAAKEFTELESNDKIVIAGGFPSTKVSKTTNLMKIEVID